MSLINRFQKNSVSSYPARFRYEALRSLMGGNVRALKILGDLAADLNHIRHSDPKIKEPVHRLIRQSFLMAQELNLLSAQRHEELFDVLSHIQSETERIFSTLPDNPGTALAVLLDTEEALDHRQTGGKASLLARLTKQMPDRVPKGFVVTARGYERFLEANGLKEKIRLLVHDPDMRKDQETLSRTARTIRSWIMQATVPDEIRGAMVNMARNLGGPDRFWAVRASAVDEDLSHSFASQFENLTDVGPEDLADAYLRVVAGRFTDQAVTYRLHHGFRDVKTPMAVLFMPMIDISAKGVLHTRDMNHPEDNVALLYPDRKGGENAREPIRIERKGGGQTIVRPSDVSYALADDAMLTIAGYGEELRDLFGEDLHLDWALDGDGAFTVLQLGRLALDMPRGMKRKARSSRILAMGGVCIFPGRAEGTALFLKSARHFTPSHKGSVVVVDEADTELSTILPDIAALIVIGGKPTDALATLARECGVPTLFQFGAVARRLVGKRKISVNTVKRTVYQGSRWRGIRERVMARISEGNRIKGQSTLYDVMLGQTLSDPDDLSFKAGNCTSIRDAVLFMHEMSVRSMFGFGDRQAAAFSGGAASQLKTALPLKCQVIDIDRTASVPKKSLRPDEILCLPFNAFWRGLSDGKLTWTRHWKHEMVGMHSDLKEAVLESNRGPRKASAMNYLIVSRDHMNFNAHLSHHFMMVDAHMGPGREFNPIHFRFRASGGIAKNRSRCASFVETVLERSGFGMDRKGDIVTGWMRCYAQSEAETVLEELGRLIVCVRELDAVLKNDADIPRYADHFLKGSYDIFA